MKRWDVLKAIPATALVPAALSTIPAEAEAQTTPPASAGGKTPAWAADYKTTDMLGTGPDGAPNGQTATSTGASQAGATVENASSKMQLADEQAI